MSVHTPFGEGTYAEEPTLEWLTELGWDHVYGADIAPDSATPEREDWADVVLRDRLAAKLSEFNPELPPEAVDQVVADVTRTDSPDPVLDHTAFHELLIEGVPVTYHDAEGQERSTVAQLVDFRQPENNDFAAINQMTIVVGTKKRRPDVLLCVNGIPLGQVELKNPADEAATPEAAVNQVDHYKLTIPGLYRFVEIIGVSDLLQARMGTITTPAEHFAEWKSMDPADDEGKPQLEVMLRGVFAPEKLVELIESFVLFETDGSNVWKLMAKYHQVDAVKRAVEKTAEAMAMDGRAGVVWHTQGSGKSLSMVFYVAKLRRDPRFENPTVVAVTDRIDLDNQLLETFSRQKTLAVTVEHAEKIDRGPDSLRALLQVPAGGIVFTTIQKFTAGKDEEMPVLSERRNIVVMADEAHRSQYDTFARNITKALPNATRIGFTGTPIEKGDRSTRLTFGDYISIYNIRRAVEDGATVPIYYESRAVPLSVEDRELLRTVEEVLEGEETEAASKLVTSWANLEKVVGAPDRIKQVAEDIAEHFADRQKTLEGKGMVVGMSRRICAELTEQLRNHFGHGAVDCVMSAQATDPPGISQFRRNKQEMRQIADDFKDPDHALKLVVVRDMWLTGFDVPALHTLYIDKPMRDHGLLQAIARVNRVFRDKPGGLVVDYIGIGDDLRAALPSYAPEDVADVTVDLEDVIKKLREKDEVLAEFFPGLDFRARDQLPPAQLATLFANAVAQVMVDDEEAERYLDEYLALSKLYALAGADPVTNELAKDAAFFGDVARAVRKLSPSDQEASTAAKQAVKQFMSEGLAAGEVVDIFRVADKDRPEISVLSDEFLDSLEERVSNSELQVALLRKLLSDEVKARATQNVMQAKQFSDALNAVLERYRQKQIDSTEVVEALVELAKKMREARQRHKDLGLTVEEAAFYDALAGNPDDWKADAELVEIAKELVKRIREDLTVDWTSHEATEAALRVNVKRVLRNRGYTPPAALRGSGGGKPLDVAADLVLDQARVIYRNWPEMPGAPETVY